MSSVQDCSPQGRAALRGGQHLPDEVLHSMGHEATSAWGISARMRSCPADLLNFYTACFGAEEMCMC